MAVRDVLGGPKCARCGVRVSRNPGGAGARMAKETWGGKYYCITCERERGLEKRAAKRPAVDPELQKRQAAASKAARERAKAEGKGFWRQTAAAMVAVPEPEPKPSAGATPADQVDLVGQIRELAQLRDDGILSVQEFEAKKAELLGRL